MKFCISLIAVAFFLPGLQAFGFKRRPENTLLDAWMQEQMANPSLGGGHPKVVEADDMGYASPGHVEEYDFMTAFFNNLDHEEFSDNAKEENHNPHIEGYLADFFGNSPKNGKSQNNHEEPAREFAHKNHEEPAREFAHKDHEEPARYFAHKNRQPSPFLRGLAHKMQTDEQISEDSDKKVTTNFEFFGQGGDKLTGDFNDFPDDNPFASIQETGELECEEWKEAVTAAQTELNNKGRELQPLIAEVSVKLAAFTENSSATCMTCETVCIADSIGHDCLDEINGTCVYYTVNTTDCARRISDPKCEGERSQCEAAKQEAADEATNAQEQLTGYQSELDTYLTNLLEVVAAVPVICQDLSL